MWSNTVVASGTAIGIIIYTGPECRATMNNATPSTKVGLIDLELNNITKLLFAATMALSVLMVVSLYFISVSLFRSLWTMQIHGRKKSRNHVITHMFRQILSCEWLYSTTVLRATDAKYFQDFLFN